MCVRPVTTRYGLTCDIHIYFRVGGIVSTRYGLICVPAFALSLSPALRHRTDPRKQLVYVRQQRILKQSTLLDKLRGDRRYVPGVPSKGSIPLTFENMFRHVETSVDIMRKTTTYTIIVF